MKLIKKRKKGIIYSINSWDDIFYLHTNENAEDFKIDFCNDLSEQKWKTYIAPREEVLIGNLVFLKDWILRSEISNAFQMAVESKLPTVIDVKTDIAGIAPKAWN